MIKEISGLFQKFRKKILTNSPGTSKFIINSKSYGKGNDARRSVRGEKGS
jgi:hypothetical protein